VIATAEPRALNAIDALAAQLDCTPLVALSEMHGKGAARRKHLECLAVA